MTEREWARSGDPQLMCQFVTTGRRSNRTKSGRRKLRLFMCACCRRGWNLIEPNEWIRQHIEFAEGYSDGVGTRNQLLELAYPTLDEFTQRTPSVLPARLIAEVARAACGP